MRYINPQIQNCPENSPLLKIVMNDSSSSLLMGKSKKLMRLG
jgi:hypothetical protein